MQEITFSNSLGSINISQSTPYVLQKLDGISGLSVTVTSQSAPFQDGSTHISERFRDRSISITGVIVACSYEDLNTKKRALQRLFNPKYKSNLRYKNETYEKDLEVWCSGVPLFSSVDKGTYYQVFLVSLVAHNPFLLDTEYNSETLSIALASLQFPLYAEPTFEVETEGRNRTIVDNQGDVETPIEVMFTGPITNPELLNETTGEFIKVNKTLLANQTLTITTEKEKPTVIFDDGTGGVNAFGLIDLESTFWQIQVGENTISYDADAGVETANMILKYKQRFLGL